MHLENLFSAWTFDGVIHSYTSGWKGADIIPDPPVEGAMKFIWEAIESFRVSIFSSRSNQVGGMNAMEIYLRHHFNKFWKTHATQTEINEKLDQIEWPTQKPPAFITIDDRAICFDGNWPPIEELKDFKPWFVRNKLPNP